jgi:rubrerythrin
MELIHKLLLESLQGETDAEHRYLQFSMQADAEGYPGIATLFTALSHGETVHAANHRKALEKNSYPGPFPKPSNPKSGPNTLANLQQAILAEKEEFTSMYPSFLKQIDKKHGNSFTAKIALLSLKWAMEAEKNHHLLLVAAKKRLQNQQDFDEGRIYLCAVCGNLHYSPAAPTELCPVCGHDASFYSPVDLLL